MKTFTTYLKFLYIVTISSANVIQSSKFDLKHTTKYMYCNNTINTVMLLNRSICVSQHPKSLTGQWVEKMIAFVKFQLHPES